MRTPLIIFLLLILCGGCKKFVDANAPDDLLTKTVVFSNDSMALNAGAGLYIGIMMSNQSLLNGGSSVYAGLSSDELARVFFKTNDDQFYRNSVSASNAIIVNNFWKPAYTTCYQANVLIESLTKSTSVSTAVKNQLRGEAKFIRALCYFYMVNLFGDVPLILSTNVDVNKSLGRTSSSKVYEQIISDLQSARQLLSDTVPNIFPTKLAATALQARVHCYLKDWDAADSLASLVCNSGTYSLANIEQVFLANSPETIFQLQPVWQLNSTAEGASFITTNNAIPTYILTDKLKAAFTTEDRRFTAWTKTVVINNLQYHYPYKYKVRSTAGAATEYNIVLRLAEQYLIRAEARTRKGNLPGAIKDLNYIRNRAGLPPLTSDLSINQCLHAIQEERQREFFCEWGHRWFDLKRTNCVDEELSTVKGANWQATDTLYPIPQIELERNPNLTQNKGY